MTRPSLRRGGIGAVLLVTAALAAGPAVTGSQARAFQTGMSGVYDYTPLAYSRVRESGARFVRIGLPWGSIAPAQYPAGWQPQNPADPHYQWGHVDEAVTNATAAGLTPLLMVNSAPLWAQGCRAPASLPEAICEPSPSALAEFAIAAARRYSGKFGGLPRVRFWQGLNEPNLSLYFDPQFDGSRAVSPELYRRAINVFYGAIKSVDPANLVLAAGLGPIAVPHWTVGPLRFTRQLLCMRSGGRQLRPLPGNCHGGVDFDIFDVHPYTTSGPAHEGGPNDVQLGDLPQLQALLRAADAAGRIHGKFKHTPLWVTEFSWDSKPPDPNGLAMKIECRWIDEALYLAWRAGIGHFFWYSLRDEPLLPGAPSDTSLQSGLYFRGATLPEDRPKQALYAFRFPFVSYPRAHGLFVWGRTPASTAGQVKIEVLRGGHWRGVGRLRADGNGLFGGTLPIGYGGDRRGTVRAVYRGTRSVPFSMHPVKEFRQPPFG